MREAIPMSMPAPIQTDAAEPQAPPAGATVKPVRRMMIQGRAVYIADGLFDSDFIAGAYSEMLARQSLGFHRINNAGTAQPLLLAQKLGPEQLAERPHVGQVLGVAFSLFAQTGYPKLTIDQLHVNFDTHGQMQFVHEDPGVDVTAIYYANPEWSPDWMGETLFYDNEDSEVLGAVTPKPGRLVLMDARIRHRGGVPSRLMFAPRVTLVAKMRRDAPA